MINYCMNCVNFIDQDYESSFFVEAPLFKLSFKRLSLLQSPISNTNLVYKRPIWVSFFRYRFFRYCLKQKEKF